MRLGSLHSCRASTHAAMQAIAAMTQVHARDPFSREQKRPERLEAYSVVGIMPLANVVSPMATRKFGFVFRTEAIT
jgi:hypothetical protein